MNVNEDLPLHLNQWVVMNRILVFYKMTTLLMGIIATLSLGYVFYLSAQPPIVISNTQSGHHFVDAEITNPKITKSDLEEATKNFIHLRYVWMDLKPEEILNKLQPFITSGFLKKVEKNLQEVSVISKKSKTDANASNIGSDSNGTNSNSSKVIKQRVLINKIEITEKTISAEFDRIIDVEGVKVVSTLSIDLEITTGEITYKNPLGLYINGVIEYEKD
ncbi:MAG: hypothetical protein HQK49_21820 [Oligoflexia bacterium]|nr:hypothetical protein [Oligoflexia bacterium]